MAWFRQRPPSTAGPARGTAEPAVDTVGNPIVERGGGAADAAHPSPTRAEQRVLEFVVERRVELPLDAPRTSGHMSGFWLIDGALATGTKAMMLDWLLRQGYIARGPRTQTSFVVVLTAQGTDLVEQRRMQMSQQPS